MRRLQGLEDFQSTNKKKIKSFMYLNKDKSIEELKKEIEKKLFVHQQ